ncbi:class I SAM-dependent methyltransferase [Haloplanus aerogenes]|uniref:Class I SAM-dependent methyltransferase family protein n=1 Tax=Haloplanus aerogenes TaxID=660522 RepID=A0A3M0DRY3_9EURY|nr:class I SAM-dependent methyltransferase family protein [Haloplanus aerogenes]AZH25280.1 class I SAM-dependent methyltransferase family protein [Haloplanus aerogenes]RMB24975.1 tRNA (guanine37-N1)-methyltransferase [Haloplanus aerogenes]
MDRPCVRVSREAGERTRQDLAAAGLLDDEYEIVVADGTLYLPVTDPDAAGESYEVVYRDVPAYDRQQTPADLLGFDPSYERLGDVAILDEDDSERAHEIAEAILDSDLPVRAVIDRASKVKGDLRVRDWTVVATADDAADDRPVTETVHREYGFEYLLDLSRVYFSPRLATERHRVTEQVEAGEQAVDMFAGVGPFVIPMAARGATVVGVDLNPAAVEYLRENARRNGVADRVTAIEDDVRDVAVDYDGWADRIVMNLPHSADDFLDAAVTLASDDCVLHYYDIQHEDDPFGPGERAIRAAAAGYDVDVLTRHVVRSYAPHELNVCLDVRLSR